MYFFNANAFEDISELSFEELMGLRVFSVTKKNQKLSESATTIHVLTAEDIKRSVVTNIPDALRMVSSFQVARIYVNKWVVSARGFRSVRCGTKLGEKGNGSAYLQDEISLLEKEIRITLGIKVEHNDFTRVEVQPNTRLIWLPNTNHSICGAISRATRRSSHYKDNAEIPYYYVMSPQLEFGLHYVDRLPASGLPINGFSTLVDDHVIMDIRLAWQPTKYLDFSVAGKNLLPGKHTQIVQEGLGSKSTWINSRVYFQTKLLF